MDRERPVKRLPQGDMSRPWPFPKADPAVTSGPLPAAPPLLTKRSGLTRRRAGLPRQDRRIAMSGRAVHLLHPDLLPFGPFRPTRQGIGRSPLLIGLDGEAITEARCVPGVSS